MSMHDLRCTHKGSGSNSARKPESKLSAVARQVRSKGRSLLGMKSKSASGRAAAQARPSGGLRKSG